MDITLLAVIGLVAVALLFDYTNGFHDSANSVSTVVATGALRPRLAVLWAAAFDFVAFAFFGTKVADTIGQTVEQGFVSITVIFAALAGAILWNYATWWLGMPTSSSQALIGGLVGAGLANGGLEAIKASNVQKAAVFMVLSPLVGMALAAAAIYQVTRLQNHLLSGMTLGLLGVAAVAVLVVGVRKTTRAADLEPEQQRPSRPDQRQPVAG